MKKLILLMAVLLLGGAGCTYRVGNLMHPQIKTAAVAPVVNETVEYNLSAHLRNMLAERLMVDGSLKLVDEKEADCIVYARIIEVRFREVSWASRDTRNDIFLPNEWQANMTVEYSVIIPGRAAPLLAARTVTGTSDFQTGPDQMIGRDNAVRQASYDASRKIVRALTEGW